MKVKIAVIDTGYDFTSNYVTSGFSLMYDEENIIESDAFFDSNGHGTNVIETILKFCPDIQIIPIKITTEKGVTNKLLLYSALEKCLELGVNIVNLSLSCTISDYDEKLEKILNKLTLNNIIIVVSLLNISNDGYPGSSKYTIGIGAINLGLLNDKCLKKCNKVYYFNSNPIFVKGYDKYNFFKGTSKATALCTAILAKAFNQGLIKNLNDAIIYLDSSCIANKDAKNIYNDYIDFLQSENHSILYSKEISDLLISLIYSYTKKCVDNKINQQSLTFSVQTGLDFFNFDDFLNKVSESLNIKIDKEKIAIEEVYSISALMNFLQRSMIK